MFPLIPILLVGGVWSGLTLSKKKISEFPQVKNLEARYQHFFQRKIDPLFDTKKRNQQIQTFSHKDDPQEIDINRRLGFAVANTGLAVLGTIFYPSLVWLSAIGLVAIMWPLLMRSFRILLREKRLKYRLFASLSVFAGLVTGYFVVSNLFAVVLFLAFKISARTQFHSQSALQETFSLQLPPKVWIQVNNVETEICSSELSIGDIIILSAGQVVPIDGEVVEGMATIDQRILTGESRPVEKSISDRVFANTVVLTGKLYVKVEQTGDETATAQIGKILSNLATHRLEHEARGEQLADKLTIPVLAASGLALVTVGGSGAAAIMNSGFGSTLFLSSPLSMLSHLSLASYHGILVKDGRALEKLSKVDIVIFDKTGTLTLEEPEISAIYCQSPWQETEVLAYAALAEHRQRHPIAKAIINAAAQRGIHFDAPDAIAYEIGFGIEAYSQGQRIHVGSRRFMQESQINIPVEITSVQLHCQETGGSLVMVAINGEIIGAIELQAQLRPETFALIKKLHQRKLKIGILSGDHPQPTRYLAQRLNIDDFFAEVLPEEKADKIRILQESGHTVCFVGDGINDAIALQQADVSVSLSGATAIATDSAQIVLMNQSLEQLNDLFEIANRFNKNLDRTVNIAYIPGTILISGVFLFHFGMPAALLLYSAGITATISNALSPLKELKNIKI